MALTSNPAVFRPSFGIYRADGSKHPTLRRNFIVKLTLDYQDLTNGYLLLDDGTSWALWVEKEADMLISKDGKAFCIVSFQVHEHGNYAVARIYSAKKQAASHYATNQGKNND